MSASDLGNRFTLALRLSTLGKVGLKSLVTLTEVPARLIDTLCIGWAVVASWGVAHLLQAFIYVSLTLRTGPTWPAWTDIRSYAHTPIVTGSVTDSCMFRTRVIQECMLHTVYKTIVLEIWFREILTWAVETISRVALLTGACVGTFGVLTKCMRVTLIWPSRATFIFVFTMEIIYFFKALHALTTIAP